MGGTQSPAFAAAADNPVHMLQHISWKVDMSGPVPRHSCTQTTGSVTSFVCVPDPRTGSQTGHGGMYQCTIVHPRKQRLERTLQLVATAQDWHNFWPTCQHSKLRDLGTPGHRQAVASPAVCASPAKHAESQLLLVLEYATNAKFYHGSVRPRSDPNAASSLVKLLSFTCLDRDTEEYGAYTDRQGTPNGQRSEAIRRARHIHASMQTPLNQHADPQSALHRPMCSHGHGYMAGWFLLP